MRQSRLLTGVRALVSAGLAQSKRITFRNMRRYLVGVYWSGVRADEPGELSRNDGFSPKGGLGLLFEPSGGHGDFETLPHEMIAPTGKHRREEALRRDEHPAEMRHQDLQCCRSVSFILGNARSERHDPPPDECKKMTGSAPDGSGAIASRRTSGAAKLAPSGCKSSAWLGTFPSIVKPDVAGSREEILMSETLMPGGRAPTGTRSCTLSSVENTMSCSPFSTCAA